MSNRPDAKPTRKSCRIGRANYQFPCRQPNRDQKETKKNVRERNLHPKIWFHVWYETKRTRTPLELLRTIIIMSKESGVIFCSICYKLRVVTKKGETKQILRQIFRVLRRKSSFFNFKNLHFFQFQFLYPLLQFNSDQFPRSVKGQRCVNGTFHLQLLFNHFISSISVFL